MRWVWTGFAFLAMGFAALLAAAIMLSPVLGGKEAVYEPDPPLAASKLDAQRAAAPWPSYWFGPVVKQRQPRSEAGGVPSDTPDSRDRYLDDPAESSVVYGRSCTTQSGLDCIAHAWVNSSERTERDVSTTIPTRRECWKHYRDAWVAWCGDWEAPVLHSGTRATAFFVPKRGDDLSSLPWRVTVGQLRRFDQAAGSAREIPPTERFTCSEWADFGPKRQNAVPGVLRPLGACA